MGGPGEILKYLSQNLQLTAPETVALMGGHAVGRAARAESGFNGVWKGRPDTFSTGYYRTLLTQPFTNVGSTFAGAQVNQWNAPGPAAGRPGPMMLNSDMEVSTCQHVWVCEGNRDGVCLCCPRVNVSLDASACIIQHNLSPPSRSALVQHQPTHRHSTTRDMPCVRIVNFPDWHCGNRKQPVPRHPPYRTGCCWHGWSL